MALEPEEPDKSPDSDPPTRLNRLLWLLLPACSSVMLLATTNQLCLDVAVVPLLWILPLGLYLLSFILCFHSPRWYSRMVFGPALAAVLILVCHTLFGSVFIYFKLQLVSYSATLFVACMVCHGELTRLKPDNRHLTAFYGMIAAGGALGGAFVTFIAPALFKGYWEFHIGLAAVAILFLAVLFLDRESSLYRGSPLLAWIPLSAGAAALIVALGVHIDQSQEDSLIRTRNFFGVLRVLDLEIGDPLSHRFTLMHGRIEHGFQFQFPDRRFWPTSYFGPGSGVGMALRYHPVRTRSPINPGSLKIGIVGLGTGTLASYGRPGDTIRFYEINPEILRLAKNFFTYLRDCPAKVDVVLGDARISMEREKDQGKLQNYDILAVDAFSSDAIPVHLLTRECYEIYRSHLKPDGILALHISSRYFDLTPVVRSLAELHSSDGMQALMISSPSNSKQGIDASDWVLLTSNREFIHASEVRKVVRPWTAEDRSPLLWTDDYSNLFHLMRQRVE